MLRNSCIQLVTNLLSGINNWIPALLNQTCIPQNTKVSRHAIEVALVHALDQGVFSPAAVHESSLIRLVRWALVADLCRVWFLAMNCE